MHHKNCQSCGMPLSRDPNGGGREADGQRSTRYCSHCYESGEFTQPTMTATQMQELVRDKLRQMGFPGFVAWFFVRGIPKLERWRGHSA